MSAYDSTTDNQLETILARPVVPVRMTVTLDGLTRCAYPTREEGWGWLRDHLGSDLRRDTQIDVRAILEHGGVDDAIRALQAVEGHEAVLREIAADIAELTLPLYERVYPTDDRPRRAIEAARAYARGEIGDADLEAANHQARAAAWDTWRTQPHAATAAAAAAEVPARVGEAASAAVSGWDRAWSAIGRILEHRLTPVAEG